jgi:hypothetical protein
MTTTTPKAKDQTTIIFIRATDDPEQHHLLKIDFVVEPADYVKKNAGAFVTETFSDSDLDIDTNGYLAADEDHADHGRVMNDTIILAVRDMTDDEIWDYEDRRDEAASEFACDQTAEHDAFDRSINS